MALTVVFDVVVGVGVGGVGVGVVVIVVDGDVSVAAVVVAGVDNLGCVGALRVSVAVEVATEVLVNVVVVVLVKRGGLTGLGVLTSLSSIGRTAQNIKSSWVKVFVMHS